MAKKVYKNKNGNLTVEEFVRLIHNNKLEDWARGHRLTTSPCPPMELIKSDQLCFRCIDCIRHCKDQVKEYKAYYKARSKKYPKEELND